MANRDIVAIGTSAGRFAALCFLGFLAKGFNHDFPASILITIHPPLQFRSHLDQLLSAAGVHRDLFPERSCGEQEGPRTATGHSPQPRRYG
jgi:hypothetical protein